MHSPHRPAASHFSAVIGPPRDRDLHSIGGRFPTMPLSEPAVNQDESREGQGRVMHRASDRALRMRRKAVALRGRDGEARRAATRMYGELEYDLATGFDGNGGQQLAAGTAELIAPGGEAGEAEESAVFRRRIALELEAY